MEKVGEADCQPDDGAASCLEKVPRVGSPSTSDLRMACHGPSSDNGQRRLPGSWFPGSSCRNESPAPTSMQAVMVMNMGCAGAIGMHHEGERV